MNKNEVINILNFRHACKEFNNQKSISKEDLDVILEGGRLAPSSVGIEPWHFIVIENQELKNVFLYTFIHNIQKLRTN